MPQPDAQRGSAQRERRVHQKTASVQHGGQTHLGMNGYHEFFHRLLGISRFARAVGEKFDGGDVGIGIGDAAGHQRAGIGLRGGGSAQFGNQETHHQGKADYPADKRQQQPAVERCQYHARRDEVHQHISYHVGQGHHHVAQRERGLHHFGRYASGKFVLIKTQRLPQHQAVEIPAQAHGEHALQGLQAHVGRDEYPADG